MSLLNSNIVNRYARSLYDLAVEMKFVAQVEQNLRDFEILLDNSLDLKRLIMSPVFSADQQLKAIAAIIDKVGIKGLAGHFLCVVAHNRRLSLLPSMIKVFYQIVLEQNGKILVDVISAHALTSTQQNKLETTLKGVSGKDVMINVTVDPLILGGLIIEMGSRQIDTSLRTQLSSLKLVLKEVH